MTTKTSSRVLERRLQPLDAADIQLIRADDGDADPKFVGHAAVFNSRTEIGRIGSWGWYEEIAPGTFTKTLKEGDARFLRDHNSSLLVARVSAGDLRLAEDKVGLAVDSDLDVELSYVKDMVRLLETKRLTGMSFGFYVVKDAWSTEEVELSNGKTINVDVRTIQEVRLLEVSAVTFPAFEETDAGLRSVCAEVRALHTDPAAPSAGAATEPDDGSTRDEGAEPDETTPHALRRHTRRADALAARYLLNR